MTFFYHIVKKIILTQIRNWIRNDLKNRIRARIQKRFQIKHTVVRICVIYLREGLLLALLPADTLLTGVGICNRAAARFQNNINEKLLTDLVELLMIISNFSRFLTKISAVAIMVRS